MLKRHYILFDALTELPDVKLVLIGQGPLVEDLKNLAKEKNFNKIQLAINKHNVRGVLIYEKWGWKLLHPVVTRFSNGFELENFMMEYTL